MYEEIKKLLKTQEEDRLKTYEENRLKINDAYSRIDKEQVKILTFTDNGFGFEYKENVFYIKSERSDYGQKFIVTINDKTVSDYYYGYYNNSEFIINIKAFMMLKEDFIKDIKTQRYIDK